MARATLPEALKLMFGHEGGYANAKSDRGGPTKYGVTHRTLANWRGVKSCSAAQVKALTLAEAEQIYRAKYWIQSGGDLLPAGLDYAAFDFGVNSGPSRAVKELQRVLGVKMDGKFGPVTLAALEDDSRPVELLIASYTDARMAFLRSLQSPRTGFPKNGRGWTIRVTGVDPEGKWASVPGVEGHAFEMARVASQTPRKGKGKAVGVGGAVLVAAATAAVGWGEQVWAWLLSLPTLLFGG